jgi:cytochrome c553
MKKIGRVIVVAAAVGWNGWSFAEGDAAAGQVKAIPCMGCHGIPGYFNVYPSYRVPKLGGQHADYLVSALKAYQEGLRGHRTMQAQAASLSDQDMTDIAAFFASQTD